MLVTDRSISVSELRQDTDAVDIGTRQNAEWGGQFLSRD